MYEGERSLKMAMQGQLAGVGTMAPATTGGGIEPPSKLPGVTREVEGMDSDLSKLQGMLQDLRARMKNGLKPSHPTDSQKGVGETRAQGSPMSEALGGLRYKIRCATEVVMDLHARLDI